MVVTEVTLNHEFLMSSYLTESERALASKGLLRVNQDERQEGISSEAKKSVLVGGFGLGYTVAEALKSKNVSSAEVVEFLPQVIGWLNDKLIPLANELNQDSRLKITLGDIYERLTKAPEATFDLILIDVDHSPQDVLGNQSFGFYTVDGLQTARSHLNPGGVFGVWSYAEDSPLLAKMHKVFSDVEVEQVTVWNDLIDVEQTDWLFFGRRPLESSQ